MYLEPSQTCRMELFCENGLRLKCSIVDVRLGFDYASASILQNSCWEVLITFTCKYMRMGPSFYTIWSFNYACNNTKEAAYRSLFVVIFTNIFETSIQNSFWVMASVKSDFILPRKYPWSCTLVSTSDNRKNVNE